MQQHVILNGAVQVEVVDHKIENIGVVVLLVEDLRGENLNERRNTHFPFSLTMRKT